MGDNAPRRPEYEAGWLDAYASRPALQPFHKQSAEYRDGYVAGEKDREDVYRKLPQLRGVHRA